MKMYEMVEAFGGLVCKDLDLGDKKPKLRIAGGAVVIVE